MRHVQALLPCTCTCTHLHLHLRLRLVVPPHFGIAPQGMLCLVDVYWLCRAVQRRDHRRTAMRRLPNGLENASNVHVGALCGTGRRLRRLTIGDARQDKTWLEADVIFFTATCFCLELGTLAVPNCTQKLTVCTELHRDACHQG